MAPKETNEDAMLRLMAGRGKGGKGEQRSHHGGGKGKGYGKGKDFSSDQIPEERRADLCEQLNAFVEGPETHLEMPPSINGLERKFLHEQAEQRGLTTQSFGQGRERYICIFKQEKPVEEEEEPSQGLSSHAEVEQAAYTGIFLDSRSRGALLDFCAKSVPGGIPHRWTQFCDHMTICVGALSSPKTEDFRSVADAVQKQIAKYREGQEFELKVVSVGRDDHVLAVGVIGCTSCNRNPHVTVATAPGHPPNISNSIKKWTMIPAEEQLMLRGVLKQHGARRLEQPPAPGWHGRRFKLRLQSEFKKNKTPQDSSWFGLRRSRWHPESNPHKRNAVMLGFQQNEAVRFMFHKVGETAGGEVLNPMTLPPGVTMKAKVPVYAIEGPSGEWLREVDEGPGPEYFVSGTVSDRSAFAFLPLEAGTHRPRASGQLEGEDAFYGIYFMDRIHGQESWNFWNQGDWPVYIVQDQLSRASDECYPPLLVHVEFEQYKVVNVEFTCSEDEILATCRGMSGDVLVEVKLERSESLRGLHKRVLQELYKQRPQTPPGLALTLMDATTGGLLSPPPPRSEPDLKLLDLLQP